jgi:PIN domain
MRVLDDLNALLMHCRGYEDTVQYLFWCGEASRQLREHFVTPERAELAERDQRDLTLGGAVMTRPREFLDRNIDLWQSRLLDARARLATLRPFIDREGQIVVIDTSAFIEGEYFTDFDWRSLAGVEPAGPVRLVVPIIVIDELDDLKRDRRGRGRARSVLHRLQELYCSAMLEPAELRGRTGVTIEVFLDDPGHQRLPDNDAEIIDRAVYIGQMIGRDVLLAASDYGMLFRAASVGLSSAMMPQLDPRQPAQPGSAD